MARTLGGKVDKKRVAVDGLEMAYVDEGEGAPTFLFLHGNPTSSYLWRHVIGSMTTGGRKIAPDLIGMGDSDKLPDSGPDSYRFVEHRRYLDGLLDQLDLGDRVVPVIHDWGSALGFDWAHRNPDRVAGIVYMEAVVRPVEWADWPEAARGIFEAMRSPAGESIVLEKNVFIERILPASILRTLADHEMAEYRKPYLDAGEARRPTLTWPREIPVGGEPADVVSIVESYGTWLETAAIPKLFVNADPGSILIGAQREYCRSWPNQSEVTVPGLHFIQEDSGPEVAAAIDAWVAATGLA